MTQAFEHSDARVKENVLSIPNCLAKITALRPVQYNFIGSPTTEYGYIAQEFINQFPQWTFTNGDNGTDPLGSNPPWQVYKDDLPPHVVGAIKELNVTLTSVQTTANNASTAAAAAQSTANSASTTASAAQTAAGNAQTTATAANSTATAASSAATAASTAANNAAVAAGTAQTTANSAQTAANAAQTTANSANTAAAAAQTTANSALAAANAALVQTTDAEGDLGTLTWNGTAPGGTITKRYKWFKQGNLCTITFAVKCSTPGLLVSSFAAALPSGAPTPYNLSNQASDSWVCMGSGGVLTGLTVSLSGNNAGLYKTSGGTYELRAFATTTLAAGVAMGCITYLTT